MIPPDTQRVLAFLGDPASYPHRPRGVRLVQTHASWVFLATPLVYKIKKPVDFGFLDFSTLERRRRDCENEVRLNRRLAGDIYHGVEAICEVGGELAFGGEGRVLEWAVVMDELGAEGFLASQLESGEVDEGSIARIAEVLVAFYREQAPLLGEQAALAGRRLRQSVEENFDASRAFVGKSLSAAALGAIETYANVFHDRHRELLRGREEGGWVRDCHGDLHSEHIHLAEEMVRIYDCIEFNEVFRQVDIACDIAFLAMDLDLHGRSELARRLLELVVEGTGDEGLWRVIDYYRCYRACVRGKVESLCSMGEGVGEAERWASLERARRSYRLALGYAVGEMAAAAYVVMGRVAAGKTALAEALGGEMGWRVISSDRVRKGFGGVLATRRSSEEERAAMYTAEMSRRVYGELEAAAMGELESGRSVVLDATYSRRWARGGLRERLDGKGYRVIWVVVEAGEAVSLERLRARETMAEVLSDAREEDHLILGESFEEPDELPDVDVVRVSAEQAVGLTMGRVLMDLAQRQAEGA
jgi:uncharacterized protein